MDDVVRRRARHVLTENARVLELADVLRSGDRGPLGGLLAASHESLECGAKQVTGGSIAVKQPDMFERWLSRFGADVLILGADAKNEKIAVSGWEEATTIWVYDFVDNWVDKGITHIISTDVAKDGTIAGPLV
jgi:phosphoribosylformimino-5-aminoimidazole carboxamide ribonucleotide (ProFAR) isomerase